MADNFELYRRLDLRYSQHLTGCGSESRENVSDV